MVVADIVAISVPGPSCFYQQALERERKEPAQAVEWGCPAMKQSCTWNGCTAPAMHEEKHRGGKAWALLCDDHHAQLERAVEDVINRKSRARCIGRSESIRRLMRAWEAARMVRAVI